MSMQLGQIDPNVKLPAAVKAAVARSDAIFKTAYEPEAPKNEEPPAPAEKATSETPPADVVEAKQPETKPVETKPAEQKAPKAEDDGLSWEHRYKSMKGRYDRAELQLRQLTEQVANLQNVIATMQTRPAQQESTPTELQAERLITPQEEQDYGSEFLTVVGKKAKEELLPLVKQYEAKIGRLEEQLRGVGGYVQQDARTRMMATLEQHLPNLSEINTNSEFIRWLQLPDPYSGAIRHDLLKEAYDRNDASRVLAFFRGFLAEEAATAPATTEAGRSEAPAKPSLEQFAAPGRAKTAAATSAPAEKPIFTRAQIAKFYADSAAGRYRGKEAEKDRIEAQIFDAEREGRIR